MTWTYDTALTADKDKVRFLVQDTDVSDPLVQDEEIAYALVQEGGVNASAALIAEALAARFAREIVSKGVDGLSLTYTDRRRAYETLATRLRKQVALEVAPYAGGITKSDKQTNESDPNIVTPIFTRHLGESDALDASRTLRSDV